MVPMRNEFSNKTLKEFYYNRHDEKKVVDQIYVLSIKKKMFYKTKYQKMGQSRKLLEDKI